MDLTPASVGPLGQFLWGWEGADLLVPFFGLVCGQLNSTPSHTALLTAPFYPRCIRAADRGRTP